MDQQFTLVYFGNNISISDVEKMSILEREEFLNMLMARKQEEKELRNK